jgi:hypothetical protein
MIQAVECGYMFVDEAHLTKLGHSPVVPRFYGRRGANVPIAGRRLEVVTNTTSTEVQRIDARNVAQKPRS